MTPLHLCDREITRFNIHHNILYIIYLANNLKIKAAVVICNSCVMKPPIDSARDLQVATRSRASTDSRGASAKDSMKFNQRQIIKKNIDRYKRNKNP